MTPTVQLRKNQILLELESSDRFSAFQEMVSHLVKTGNIPYGSERKIIEQLREREEQSTFAVGKGIAIPHINGAEVNDCTFLYARTREGIEFGSCDTGLVHHLFLALIPEEKKCGWLKILAQLGKELSSVDVRDALMELEERETACELLERKFSELS